MTKLKHKYTHKHSKIVKINQFLFVKSRSVFLASKRDCVDKPSLVVLVRDKLNLPTNKRKWKKPKVTHAQRERERES